MQLIALPIKSIQMLRAKNRCKFRGPLRKFQKSQSRLQGFKIQRLSLARIAKAQKDYLGTFLLRETISQEILYLSAKSRWALCVES